MPRTWSLSLDGVRNGLFTETMKKVWSGGKFKYGYRRFRDTIVAKMPPTQTPNYFVIGKKDDLFESQKPFTVGKAKAGDVAVFQ